MAKSTKKSTKPQSEKVELSGKLLSFICSIAAIIMCLLALVVQLFAKEPIDITWFILLLSNVSILLANINIAKLKELLKK